MRTLGFSQASGLALELAQVEQLGAAHLIGAHYLNFIEDLGVEGENSLYALPKADLAHGKAAAGAVAPGNDGAFKSLDAFLVAFLDLDLDTDSVAGIDLRNVLALQLGSKFCHDGMLGHSFLPL